MMNFDEEKLDRRTIMTKSNNGMAFLLLPSTFPLISLWCNSQLGVSTAFGNNGKHADLTPAGLSRH